MAPATPEHVVIYEPISSGHRMHYVRWIAESLAAHDGQKITLVTTEQSVDHDAVHMLRATLGDKLDIHVAPELTSILGSEAAQRGGLLAKVRQEARHLGCARRAVREIAQQRPVDLVFLPYMDYSLRVLGLIRGPFGGIPWAGIPLRPRFHMEAMGIAAPRKWYYGLEQRLFVRMLGSGSLAGVFCIDPFLVSFLQKLSPEAAAKVAYLPDPADALGDETRETARRSLGIPDDRIVVLVFGTLSLRKGVGVLVDAARDPGVPGNVMLLLAGAQTVDVADYMRRPEVAELTRAGRLLALNRFLGKEDEARVFKAADIVWLGYRGHYESSGVQIQAAQAGLPVLAANEGLVGRLTEDCQSGLTVPVDRTGDVAGALGRLAADAGLRERRGKNGRDAFANHTPENFRAIIRREVLGATASRDAPASARRGANAPAPAAEDRRATS